MVNPFLSIIIPIYNVEKYLHKCINSILVQKFMEYELILVDDGSSDSSGNICDNYAKIDSRIKVIHQKNRGVNNARNKGICISKGMYVTFIDSDDELKNDTLIKNMNIIKEHKEIDILQFPEYRVKGGNEVLRKNYPNQNIIFDRKDVIFKNWYNPNFLIPGGLCGKIYKKKIFIDFKLPEDIHFAEDQYCVPDFVRRIEVFYVSIYGGYLYNYREGSTLNSIYTPSKALDYARMKVHILKSLKYYNISDFDKTIEYISAFKSFLYAYLVNKKEHIYISKLVTDLNDVKSYLSVFNNLSFNGKLWFIIIKLIRIPLIADIYKLIVCLKNKQ